MRAAYYNEIDPFAASWLRNLIKEGLIADGDVDERSIADVDADDLRGFRQCHFFAGIGGWSYAMRLAGWPDDRPVWTGSCPCQPFSVAGKGKATADERHLWPEFHRLIAECKPAIVFGEQVASRAGREWFAGVRADLEDVGYGAAAADLCAAGVGAPHIRQRLYWVGMADAESFGRGRWAHVEDEGRRELAPSDPRKGSNDMADADDERSQRIRADDNASGWQGPHISALGLRDGAGFWADVEWRRGADGKERRVKPGIRLLVDGVPNRVGRLRGYGNAIVPQVAAAFIKSTETHAFNLTIEGTAHDA